jgi:hypothetical protein
MSFVKTCDNNLGIVDDLGFVSGVYNGETIAFLEQELKEKEKILITLNIDGKIFYIADKEKIKKIIREKKKIKKLEFTEDGEIIFYYERSVKVYKLTRVAKIKM